MKSPESGNALVRWREIVKLFVDVSSSATLNALTNLRFSGITKEDLKFVILGFHHLNFLQ